MAQSVTLPLSELNAIPGVSGVDDVGFSIPEPDDIIDEFEDRLFTTGELRAIISEETLDDTDVAAAVNDLLLGQDVFSKIDRLREDGILDSILEEVRAVEAPDSDIIEDIIVEQLSDQEIDIEGIQVDTDALADDIVDELDDEDIGGTSIEFESVFGATASTIQQAINETLETLSGQVSELQDSVDELNERLEGLTLLTDEDAQGEDGGEVPGVPKAIEAILIALPGGALLLSPADFLKDIVVDLVELLVSDESADNLSGTLEDR